MQSLEPVEKGACCGAVAAVAPAVHARAAEQAGPSVRRLRIFIVEDNEIIRESLVATLEELADAEVVGNAVDEWTAVQWLSDPAKQCDLAIVDIFLRSGSGLGVLRSCREMGPERRLIVLSNYATEDIRHTCTELGADAVFDKSNDIDALLDYCRRLGGAPAGIAGSPPPPPGTEALDRIGRPGTATGSSPP